MSSRKVYKPRKIKPVFLIILFLLLIANLGYSLYFQGCKNRDSISPIITLLFTAFFVYTFFAKRYTLDTGNLYIKMGFLYNKKISIFSIKKIKEISSPFSKSATNLDVFYNKFDNITISLSDKDRFIKDLLKINPDIEIKYRKKK